MRILLVSKDKELVALARHAVQAAAGSATTVTVAGTARDALTHAESADGVVLDLELGGSAGRDLLRQIRTLGGARAVVAIAPRTAGPGPESDGARDLEAVVRREEVPRLLGPTVRAAVERRAAGAAVGAASDGPGDDSGAARHDVSRAGSAVTPQPATGPIPDAGQRLDELFRVAARVQHELNNPLAALLAETQLLSLEPGLAPEHREAVERIIELIRRVIGIVRRLDEVKGEKS